MGIGPVLAVSAENVNILQRIPVNINKRQQINNEVFPNKNCSAYAMERPRQRPTIQFPQLASYRLAKHGGRFTTVRKVRIKLHDDILMSPVQVCLQSTDVADENNFSNEKIAQEKNLVNNVPWPKKTTKIVHKSHQSSQCRCICLWGDQRNSV